MQKSLPYWADIMTLVRSNLWGQEKSLKIEGTKGLCQLKEQLVRRKIRTGLFLNLKFRNNSVHCFRDASAQEGISRSTAPCVLSDCHLNFRSKLQVH